MDEPTVLKGWPLPIQGGLSVDDRGTISYANDFDFMDVKRFYMISNHQQGFVRAFHGHEKESKYVLVVHGAIVVAAVQIDIWDTPSKKLEVRKYVLSADKPTILRISAGWANGFMNLTKDTKVMFFSNRTLEESLGDDFRYPADYWGRNVWDIEER